MEKGLFNITSATTTTLIEKLATSHNVHVRDYDRGNIRSINIANCNDSNLVYVSLYLDDGTNQTYFFKTNILWPGQTMILDKGVGFNSRALSLKLTTTGTSPDVNVIIR